MRRLLLLPLAATAATLLLFCPAAASSPPTDKSLFNCTGVFSCGPLVNVSYPFTGGDRPAHCGPPEFRLSCIDGSPELTADFLTYRVLALDQAGQSLTLSRTDLYNNTCLQHGTVTSNYYLIGAVATDPILNVSKCNVSVTVPILQSAVIMLTANRSALREALMEGFAVNYSNPYEDQCVMCGGIGGECGFDSDQGKPICICGDQICSTSTAGSNIWRKLLIGGVLVIGVSIFAIAIIFTWKVLLFKNKKDHEVEQLIGILGSLVLRRYRYTDLKKMTKSFSEKLGQGGFGAVYKGKTRDGCFVAVKILKELKSSPKEFINEVVSISRTSHINVVSLLGFCYEGKKRALIFEYMPNDSLDKFINLGKALNMSSSLEWKIIYKIAIGIAHGLEYLHQGCNTRILHLDIKPHNILLDREFNPKISDFGLAKLCHGRESAVSTLGMRGTVGFIAPEVVCQNLGRVSHKSDVYSYGMLVLDMVCIKNHDIKMSNSSEKYFPEWIYRNLELGKDIKLPMNVTKEEEVLAMKIIIVSLWCIQTRPCDRPPIRNVVEMLGGSLESLQMPPKPILYSP
ncbi:hypothetical protein EUGRSUZ_A00693 [Eucalyptus grandis]|uniref:Uncharacterized protein n=2 Tax=Eucalyptus grandis TaxID=71139 RepID=A0ACC3M0L1_EUCGR|nr:hypothetical protein EUGRSUZ_A00693 [Eucalyptus grandis]